MSFEVIHIVCHDRKSSSLLPTSTHFIIANIDTLKCVKVGNKLLLNP